MNEQIEGFVALVRTYCHWCEREARASTEEALTALSLLPNLYSAALQLPEVFADEDAPIISDEEWQRVFVRFESLPFNYYASCFDPHRPPFDEKPVVADAADDLADIWRDLKGGLSLYDAGHVKAAVCEWRFQFLAHWGHHLASLLYAMHCWFAQNQDKLSPNETMEPTR